MPYTSPSHSSSSAGERDEKTRPWMDERYAPGEFSVLIGNARLVLMRLGIDEQGIGIEETVARRGRDWEDRCRGRCSRGSLCR